MCYYVLHHLHSLPKIEMQNSRVQQIHIDSSIGTQVKRSIMAKTLEHINTAKYNPSCVASNLAANSKQGQEADLVQLRSPLFHLAFLVQEVAWMLRQRELMVNFHDPFHFQHQHGI